MIRCMTKAYKNLGRALNVAIERGDRIVYSCGDPSHYHVKMAVNATERDLALLMSEGRLIAA